MSAKPVLDPRSFVLLCATVLACGSPYEGAYDDESGSSDEGDFRAGYLSSSTTGYGSSSTSSGSTSYGSTTYGSTSYGTSSSTGYSTGSSSSSSTGYSTGSSTGSSSTTYSSGDTSNQCDDDADCDDDNECTDDACSGGTCSNTAVADGTECVDEGNECTKNVCSSGSCTHPDEDIGLACDDEPEPDTDDKCCAGACKHYVNDDFYLSYSAPLMDPQYGDRNGDGVVNGVDQCQLGSLSATLSGPGEGDDAEGAEYTFVATFTMLGPDDPSLPAHCRTGSPEGGVSGRTLLQGVAASGDIPGLTYDPATGTGTLQRKQSTDCGGGLLDFTLNHYLHSNVFFLSASVDVGVDECCFIESVDGDLGPLIFHHAP